MENLAGTENLPRFRGIQRVAFDLDGTLYPPSQRIDDTIRNYIASQLSGMLSAYGDLRQVFDAMYSEHKSTSRVLEILFADGGLENAGHMAKVLKERWLDECDMSEAVDPNPALVMLFSDIQLSGRSADIITAAPRRKALGLLNKIGITNTDEVFGMLLTSEDGDKLNGDVYRNYLERIKMLNPSIIPANILMIGDTPDKDYFPAASLGMNTCWLCHQPNKPNPNNLNRITNILQVGEILVS